MDKCETCLNARPIISESGIHYNCRLSTKRALFCRFGDADSYTRKKPIIEHQPTAMDEVSIEMLYQSPITIIDRTFSEIQTSIENGVIGQICSLGINVNKEELIKALKYDRDQYRKGFMDGSRSSVADIKAEVAREIFEEIERVAMSKIDENAPISTLGDIAYIQAIDEVREKYTEGEK